VERRSEGLTTEDLAGTRAEEDDLRVESSERTDSDRNEPRETGEHPTSEGRSEPEPSGEPIAVGPVQEPPIILEERQEPESLADRTEGSPGSVDERTGQRLPSDEEISPGPPPPGDLAPERVDVPQGPESAGSTSVVAQEMSEAAGPLIAEADREEFTARWKDVQFRFVEEPRSAVQQADGLVAEVMQRLAQTFADERANLDSQWSQGDRVSTEDLRQAFRRYRSFFDRLLET
jgi:hypothetical protein